MSRALRPLLLGVALAALILLGLLAWQGYQRLFAAGPDVATIASASVEGLREQRKLSAFAANFSAPVTTTITGRLGLKTTKTTIFHGAVQYQVDLARLKDEDVRWDAGSRTLSVRLPPVETTAPAIDIANVQSYGGGGLLATFSNSESAADRANARAGVASMTRQAQSPVLMKLARDAHRRAIVASFALPLRAAGVDARVIASFADEDDPAVTSRWDESRPIADVLAGSR